MYLILSKKEVRGKINCRTTEVPIEQNNSIGSDEDSSSVNKGQYQRLVGNSFT